MVRNYTGFIIVTEAPEWLISSREKYEMTRDFYDFWSQNYESLR